MYMRYIQVYVIDVDRKKKKIFWDTQLCYLKINFLGGLFLHCFYFQTAEE